MNIGLVVVHGIGEQHRQSPMREVALNVYSVLTRLVAVGRIHNLARLLEPENEPRPVRFRFERDKELWEFRFYEGYWADLDLPYTFLRPLALWVWALTLPLRIRQARDYYYSKFRRHAVEPLPATEMRLVRVSTRRSGFVRALLGLAAVLFLAVLVSLRLGSYLWYRVSRKDLRWGQLLHDYLGDVKLYVDQRVRWDKVETTGLKSHEAIRQRFFDAYVRAALETDRVFILSHSLGTVATFTGLMELERKLFGLVTHPALRNELRARGMVGNAGAVSRERLFANLGGVITVGSPLDKFAAIWPRFVPINQHSPRQPDQQVPWHNVHDVLDIVGANLNYYSDVPGFKLENHAWTGQWWFWRAHTSYWKAGPGRLIDQIVEGILAGRPAINLPASRGGKWLRAVVNLTVGGLFVAVVVLLWSWAIRAGLGTLGGGIGWMTSLFN